MYIYIYIYIYMRMEAGGQKEQRASHQSKAGRMQREDVRRRLARWPGNLPEIGVILTRAVLEGALAAQDSSFGGGVLGAKRRGMVWHTKVRPVASECGLASSLQCAGKRLPLHLGGKSFPVRDIRVQEPYRGRARFFQKLIFYMVPRPKLMFFM